MTAIISAGETMTEAEAIAQARAASDAMIRARADLDTARQALRNAEDAVCVAGQVACAAYGAMTATLGLTMVYSEVEFSEK
jgi:hypothetical protein